MRVIIIGDRSRYQFLRILNPKGEQTAFHTEEFAKKDIHILSALDKVADGYFYSKRIPIGTEVIFPSEFTPLSFLCERSDKILIFDEFPYRTASEITQYKHYIKNNHVTDCSIIIVDNHVETLKTDITDMNQAISDAVQEYQSEGFFVSIYDPDTKHCNFLFRSVENLTLHDETEYALEKILNGKVKLKVTFESSYKRALMLEAGIYRGSMDFICKIGSLIKYDKQMSRQPVFSVLERNVFDYFWGKRTNEYFKFVDGFYEKKLKDYIGEYCLWDLEKDVDLLNDDISRIFQKAMKSYHKKEFVTSEIEYEIFEENCKTEINDFRNKIIAFFEDDLKQIIKERLIRHIEKIEKLLKGNDDEIQEFGSGTVFDTE